MTTKRMQLIGAIVALGAFFLILSPPATFAGVPRCDVADLQSYAPASPWPLTITSATDVPAAPPTPEYCDVIGYVTTNGEGAGPGQAGFEVGIPAPGVWNGKYLFIGNGGLGVGLSEFLAGGLEGLQKGYAVATTDMGHPSSSPFDGTWALLSPGVPNTPALIDYYYRATHETTLAGKQFVEAYYKANGGNGKIAHSYYYGCSTGGRQGLLEAERYPDDFDGLIAGDPVAGFAHQAPSQTGAEFAFLRPADAWIPPNLLAVIDAAVYTQCDPHHIGIVQNPLACSFDPTSLLCNGSNTGACLSPDQVNGLIRYGGPFYDAFGNTVMPGYPMTDLSAPGSGIQVMTLGFYPPIDPTAAEPWVIPGNPGASFTPIHWGASDGTYPYFVFLTESYNQQDFPVTFYGNRGVIGEGALLLNDFRTDFGDTTYPQLLQLFATTGKKMILYHGFSDPLITPYQTIQLYKDTASITPGGYAGLQESVRLFMVPGMFHCEGGPGPNTFDTLTALEEWVEQRTPPDGILATGGSTSKCGSLAMPLCKFPEVATYNDTGSACDAASWTCDPRNEDLLQLGQDGHLAGLPYSYLGR